MSTNSEHPTASQGLITNRLLAALSSRNRGFIEPYVVSRPIVRGDVLFEPGDDIAATDFPGRGIMWGVRRTTVTGVATSLRARGVIGYGRGRLVVLDRAAMQAMVRPSYVAVENHFSHLLPEVEA